MKSRKEWLTLLIVSPTWSTNTLAEDCLKETNSFLLHKSPFRFVILYVDVQTKYALPFRFF